MPTSDVIRAGLVAVLVAGATGAGTDAVYAFDPSRGGPPGRSDRGPADGSGQGPAPSVNRAPDRGADKLDRSPWAVFRFGFSAYQRGDKTEAVQAYRYAADNGQIGARWKLARMYAEGDGVTRNDYEAFKFFQDIVRDDVEPGSPEESYVSDALVELGNYARDGIPGTPVKPNLAAAQDYFMRAAATYRNPIAQFEVGEMYLTGDGVKKNLRQAGRWLQLAAEKGHVGAAGDARKSAVPVGPGGAGAGDDDCGARACHRQGQGMDPLMQEEAFALAGEADRRTAIAMADNILSKGDSQ